MWAWVLVACGTVGSSGTTPTGTPEPEPTPTPTDVVTSDTGTPATTSATTWHRDVRPLVEQHCATCHTDGGVAPFTFDDPAELDVLGPLLVSAVQDRTMPPWSFRDDCREVDGDLSLDAPTRAVFTTWAADGYALGDEADYVAPELPTVEEPPPADVVAYPIRPFTPDLSGPDDYVCLVSDLPVPDEMFVRWAQARPDHPELVHHVVTYAVPPEQLGRLEALAHGDLTQQFPCWESPVEYIGPTIDIWQPGPRPPYVERKDAVRVPAGSVFVLEVHFNDIGGVHPTLEDRTAIELWTLPEEQVENLLMVWPAVDYGIDIPAGEANAVNDLTVHLPVHAELATSSPHMHLLGTELRTRIRRGGSSSEQCVSDVDWDFDWQRRYAVPEGVTVAYAGDAGDVVDLRCVYDNSAAHQPVVDGVRQEPRDVVWGDSSLDEMCMDFLTFRVPFDPTASKGMCGGFDHCYQACAPDDPYCPLICMGNAGGACYACGFEAMYGACSASRCLRESVPLLACLALCDDLESDSYGCQLEECGRLFEDYQACAQPLFREGTCSRDYEACSGLVP
ncbi:MAG: hypothetical protein H6738_15295 [Alphaproteobacteria bacterium]|nr:hypothetical protein [Alphaproteobacteria bacterium]MCB9698143.1 hypothetical protein [Alphaproteobacteria bacterium]